MKASETQVSLAVWCSSWCFTVAAVVSRKMQEGKSFLLALPGLELACCVSWCIPQVVHHDTVLSVTGTVRSSIYKALLLLRHLFTLICAPGQKFQYLQGIFSLRHRRHIFRLAVALAGWRPNSGYSLIEAGYVWWKVVGNKVIDLKEDIESWIMQLRFCCGAMGWRL